MASAGIVAAKAKLELAEREWIPDPAVSLQAQRYNGGAQGVSEVSAGLSFNVPWLNGKKYRAEEAEARLNLTAAERALDSARIEALGLLRDQLRKIETYEHHLMLFESQLIPNARQTLETNRTGYESGGTGFLEVVRSERALREIEAMEEGHRADRRMALAELETIAGADLHLFSPHNSNSKPKSK